MEPLNRDREIFVAVALETVAVKLVAVDLEADNTLNHKVDRARVAREEHLLGDGQAALRKTRPRETLGE